MAAPATTSPGAPKWAPDESTNACTACKTPFTLLNRRHHCRRCGGLFCNDCCGLTTSLPEQFGQKKRSRVCNKCFKLTIKERITQPDFATLVDGGPSAETKVVSSMQKMMYWKMGAHDGGLFDRTTIDMGETSAGAIAVQQLQDLVTDSEINPVRIRLYTPSRKWKGSDKRAILVWFHTGHFCTRSIESPSVDGLARLLANQIPTIVVSVDYRLAPDHAFPAAIEDAYEALSWTIRGATNMGSDPSLVSVGGDGAGGNIAAAVAQMARDKGLPHNAKLLSQILVAPPLNLTDSPTGPEYQSRITNKNAYMLPLSQFQWFAQQYAKTDKTSPYASPILATDLSNLPASLVISAGHDLFCSEDKAYAEKLRAAGVPTIYTQYSNSANGFFGSGLDESDEAMMEVVLFLAREIIAGIRKLLDTK
eukprot:Phypoly_transcript_08466.p1 GENE.Phypoly_transcript_08466~~Phypoly_transcript_08466.p1  ORF type:complete len:434 (+),score=73.14 Phypoly_transcript_08466:42-1304(+)